MSNWQPSWKWVVYTDKFEDFHRSNVSVQNEETKRDKYQHFKGLSIINLVSIYKKVSRRDCENMHLSISVS